MSAELRSEIEIIDFDLSELLSLEVIAKRPNVKTLLTNETNRLRQKKNQLLKQLKDLSSSESNSSANSGSQRTRPSMGTVVVTTYMWDQTDDHIKIYLESAKNDSLNSDQIEMSFPTKRSFAVIFGKYKFTISKLFDDIDSTNSYHKLMKSGKVIIYLKKSSSRQWSSINEVDNKFKKTMDEEKKELSNDGAEDPSAGLMKLMKQMYDEGDDDMKRTIAKSWYESRNKTSDVDIKSDDSLNI